MPEHLHIQINAGPKTILKVGFMVRAGFILIAVIAVAFLGLNFLDESVVASVICFGITFVLFLIFFKLLNSAFFKEFLIVTKDDLTVIQKTLSETKKNTFRLNEINYLGFADQQYTKHPLDNPIVDFTGLATQERELQYVIDEGNIKIATDRKTMKFGKHLPSWEVEEMIEKIEKFSGKKFQTSPQPVYEAATDLSSDEIIEETKEETELSADHTERHLYQCDEGELAIAQKNNVPSTEDMAYLNGSLAPTGKYKIGEKQFVMVSNGLIYAVRGFD